MCVCVCACMCENLCIPLSLSVCVRVSASASVDHLLFTVVLMHPEEMQSLRCFISCQSSLQLN